VAKGNRNRQQAREKIAQMRAQEAQRRRRRLWLAGLGAVVVVAAAAVAIALAVSGSSPHAASSSSPRLKLASLSTLGTLRTAPSPGPLGPEGVPIPSAAPLAGTATAATGHPVDGIKCQTNEQVLFHIHAHLTIFVRGAAREVPAGIGIAPPYQVEATPGGAFVAGAACFMWLHTHAADGIIHTESPVQRTYTLGDFFDIWGKQLNRNQVGPAHGRVTALFNGQVFTGSPRTIPLLAHAQIQLEIGRPLVVPQKIAFPQGL
jgi:hypothetical protein